MKIEVSKSVTIHIGGKNFYKSGFTITDECEPNDLEETKERLEAKADRWNEDSVDKAQKKYDADFKGH